MAEKDWRGIALGLDEIDMVPELARKTRNNKGIIEAKCRYIAQLATQFQREVADTPELDDRMHADLVEEVRNSINAALTWLDYVLALHDVNSNEYKTWEEVYGHRGQ